jgi:hypothetical protein
LKGGSIYRLSSRFDTPPDLHPNDAGYAVMEPLAEKAMDAALKQAR